jgi:beta-glucuronidase
VIQNLPGRRAHPLSGRWRCVVDPTEAGYRNPFTGEPWKLGWFRDFPVRPGLAEVDFARADLLAVPGDWNTQDPRLLFYEGTVWYRRRVALPPAPGRRRFLHFGAANYEAVAWWNGEELGRHEGGFTPFAFELTGAARAGAEDVLTVKVDATRRREGVPALATDWWNYGGLTRDVHVVDVPGTFVREYAIGLDPVDPGRLRARLALDGPEPRQSVRVHLPELGLELRGTTDAAGRAELEAAAPAALERWRPGRPRLYEVIVESESDRVAERVGFRSLATRGHEILLNGEPLFLRGVSLHEEAPAGPGRACGPDDARVLLGWARELGCNFVRLAHYPHDEATVRLADALGLVVWAEIPVYWNIAWEEPAALACAKRQLEELVARDRNRASVALWSVANEAPPSEPRARFLEALVGHARALDPTRLVTAALMARFLPAERDGEGGRLVLDDPLAALLDVVGCNEYLGWYVGAVEDVPRVRWEAPHGRPVVVSEFGAGAVQGRHGSARELFTEEHQAAVYEAQLAMLRRVPFLAGLSPWILKDFRSPRRVLRDVQDYYNRKGLLSERGVRKLAFSVLQSFYRERAGAGAEGAGARAGAGAEGGA